MLLNLLEYLLICSVKKSVPIFRTTIDLHMQLEMSRTSLKAVWDKFNCVSFLKNLSDNAYNFSFHRNI